MISTVVEKGITEKRASKPAILKATSSGDIFLGSSLLEKRVDVNIKDSSGQTPLSLAAKEGHETVVRLLLATDGVGPNSKNTYSVRRRYHGPQKTGTRQW